MPISLTPWLTPEERAEVIERLIFYQLIKWDNSRKLKLKSGGLTDIYINLRNARNIPKASPYVARVFANPIFRLNPDRFIEVPDAVTPFSSRISELTNIPYITVRKEVKEGRTGDAKISGQCFSGERVCVYDDVITDGQSKLGPYQECLARDLKILPLVVLVDRQQGWKKKFVELGINMDVWPGMTLHDVRRYLVENGYMERCDIDLEKKNPLIIAFDGKSWEEILPFADALRTSGCIIKVNDLLFQKGAEKLIPDLSTYGRVMVDPKSYDISNTIENIMKHLLPNPPWAVTVHASGSKKMIQAAVNILKDTPTKVLAVTVLTSFDAATCEEIYVRRPMEQVLALALIAYRAGAHGLVCSPEEVSELRRLYPNMTLVTPGVRSPGADKGDQARVDTPAAAIANGADYIVGGRQFLTASDPVAEVKRVLKEELKK
ncbi:MAG: orotidine-5'-phosphate decarboxylase [Candidatus Moranbacteria bacterium]|nr:orotidine-5'-phosphate decarboxylase [Candidatus Moranbacteria bacterium]